MCVVGWSRSLLSSKLARSSVLEINSRNERAENPSRGQRRKGEVNCRWSCQMAWMARTSGGRLVRTASSQMTQQYALLTIQQSGQNRRDAAAAASAHKSHRACPRALGSACVGLPRAVTVLPHPIQLVTSPSPGNVAPNPVFWESASS